MKSFLTLLLSLFFLSSIISCNNSSTTSSSAIDSDSINVDTLTLIERQREEAKTRDSLPTNCSAQQAIDYLKTSGYWDEYSKGIIPSLIKQHLPYAQRLINNKHEYFIIVDKNSMMVVLYDKFGRRKLNYKMACGRNYGHKRAKADCRTPEGFFLCQGKYDSTDWLYTNDWGVTSPVRGQFGPRFIRVCPQIGIHGTGARYSIGRRCSHGCIRIQNENILELFNYAKVGMPIIVNPGPNDINANKKNGISMPTLVLPDIVIENPEAIIDFDKNNAQIKSKNNVASIDSANSSEATDNAKMESQKNESELQENEVNTPSTTTSPNTSEPNATKQEIPSNEPSKEEPKVLEPQTPNVTKTQEPAPIKTENPTE